MIVMVNVACHAGTCYLYWTTDTVNDFGNAQSIAYTSLNINSEARRWTTIHEAGGNGFGKLADEYEGYRYTSFSTSEWTKLTAMHGFGVSRNVNEHWDEIEDANFNYQIKWPYTKYYNVYWNDLLNDYGYDTSEGLGIYKGGNTFIHMYCRATSNSTMRDQFGTNGQFFNAISRWAIWYRLMRLTGSTQATEFKESLDEFIEFDRTLTITMTEPKVQTRSTDMTDLLPLAPPTMIEGRWEGPEFKVLEDAIIK
jgi:hypothetical protein